MLGRATAIWCVLLAIAVANGAARETAITPRMGERAGHAISTIALCVAILLVAWTTIGWLRPADRADALAIGGLWLVLTLAFELLAGHYLFGNPWSRLLADYNLLRGRIWILVPATTALAPLLALYGRRL